MVERVQPKLNGAPRWIAAAVVSVVAMAGLVTATSGPASSEAFPGTNGKIVFAKARAEEMATDLWTMDPDGSSQVQLTTPTPFSDALPQWSPDGTKIAFQRSSQQDDQIWVVDADGSDPTQLTTFGAGANSASWSPDSTKIVFSTYVDSTNVLYVMNADGSDQHQLMPDIMESYAPSWSPDGTKIAFTSEHVGTGADQVWVVDADGSNPTPLTTSEVYAEQAYTPSWSPDGTQIFFVQYLEGEGEFGYIMNADGSDPHQVSAARTGLGRWSPDGELIAINYNTEASEPGIYTIRPDGSDLTPLVLGSVWDPSWQTIAVPVPPTTESTTTTTAATAAVAVTPLYAG